MCLAADDETAIVVECKASSKAGPKSLGKDLNEAYGIRPAVVHALRTHFGVKQKIGWIFATRGIVWNSTTLIVPPNTAFGPSPITRSTTYLRLADLDRIAARSPTQSRDLRRPKIDGLSRQVLAVRGEIAGKRSSSSPSNRIGY